MALQKQIDFNNGVVTNSAYILISNINIDYKNKSANINVETYLNKDIKDAGKLPITTDYFYVSDNNAMLPTTGATATPELNFTKYFATGGELDAENYLLTLDKFKDATIVD